MFVCAAVVGPANNPLHLVDLIETPDEEPLRLHYMVHCALDVVDERLGTGGQAGGTGSAASASAGQPAVPGTWHDNYRYSLNKGWGEGLCGKSTCSNCLVV